MSVADADAATCRSFQASIPSSGSAGHEPVRWYSADGANALLGPVGEVRDVVAQRPARRELGARPGRPRHPLEQAVELGQGRAIRGPERLEVGRARVLDERVAVRLAPAQHVDPRLDDREVIEPMAVQDHVHPAPALVAADRLDRKGPGSLQQALASGVEALADRVRRHGRPRLAAPLVVRVEVAAVVVVVGRPAARRERHADVVGRELLPVRDVPDVLREGPVGAACIRRSSPGEGPGLVRQACPRRDEAIPDRGLVRPEVALRGAQVDRAQVRERRAPEIRQRRRGRADHESCRRVPADRATDASSCEPSSSVRR